jgi:adenylate cyclase
MCKIKFLGLFLLISLATLPASALQSNLDSLYAIWKNRAQTDSVRIQAFSTYISQGFLFSNPDTSTILADELITFGKKQPNPKAQATGFNFKGVLCGIKGNYPMALDYFTQSLKIQERLGDQKEIVNLLSNIGIIYSEQGDYLKAVDYFNRCLKTHEQLGDQYGIAQSLVNIGMIYKEQGDYPKALDYSTRSLTIAEQLGDQLGISAALSNMGSAYLLQGNYSKALDYTTRGLKIDEKIGDQSGIAVALGNIGSIYFKQGNYPKALGYCQKGYNLAMTLGVFQEQKKACQCLYDTYKALGKGNDALVYLEKMNVINDSLNAEETSKKLQQMEFAKVMLQDSIARAEEARVIDEAHKEEVHQKNEIRNWLIGAALLFLLLAGGLYIRWRFVQQSKAVLQLEKDRSENLLLNILPADIAEELKQKGKADARDFEMVSIIFTDFKGFTEASAKLSAQDLVAEINACFEAFDAIMAKYGIEKIKTIGDAYMAAGGLPVPSVDSVKNTVKAALEMQAFISKRKTNMDAQNKLAFEMRLGIHTGPVVAGIVGVKKFQYDIWGDTVNTASRMESSGEVGKVNISESTYGLLKNNIDFAFESRGKIEAKGKGEVQMYFVKLSEQ